MPQHRKLIAILIDGLSADYFEAHHARLPHLSALAAGGTRIARLASAMPATSMPGRATMLTGVAPDRHGAWGNHVFDGQGFRCALANDLQVPTVAGRARACGLDVAAIGHAMVHPGDADCFYPPWWLRGFVAGSRFAKAARLDDGIYTDHVADPEGRLAAGLAAGGPLALSPDAAADPAAALMNGMANDHRALSAVAALACSDTPPDLILTEVAMTDAIQHLHGFASEPAHWAFATADLLVGSLLQRLQAAGRLDEYVVAVCSDHGHAQMETALYPGAILPGYLWEGEGATLHVVARSAAERREAEQRLAAFGATPLDSAHVPEPHRDQIATFVAPDRHSFEEKPAGLPDDRMTGRPKYISTHGLRPGDPADDRFCAFLGAGIDRMVIDRAASEDYLPMLAGMLGLPASATDRPDLLA
ncbi:MAG: alkaline phosphatase family protein [Sneathiellaceae bacterium]